MEYKRLNRIICFHYFHVWKEWIEIIEKTPITFRQCQKCGKKQFDGNYGWESLHLFN